MKKAILFFSLAKIFINSAEAQVKIGDNPNSINTNALLELESTNKGFLAPRMVQAGRTGMTNPIKGMLVYQTDATEGFYYYTGSAFGMLASGVSSQWSTAGISIHYDVGNLGVGTSSPSCLLSISSASATTGGIGLANFEGKQNVDSGNNVSLQLLNNSATNNKTATANTSIIAQYQSIDPVKRH